MIIIIKKNFILDFCFTFLIVLYVFMYVCMYYMSIVFNKNNMYFERNKTQQQQNDPVKT